MADENKSESKGKSPSVDDVFGEAIRRTPGDARAAYLDEVCGENSSLRQRVERLVRASEEAQSFLESPAVDPSPTIAPPIAEQPGDTIDAFRLLQQIGEGGFGVVYMADQLRPVKRRVVLKIIKPGMDTKEVVARFEAERQALALMDHTNIAKVHDGGATDSGRPYFVMELVKGVRLTEFCDNNRLSVRQRLELFGQVCRAIQHAHQKGVIHRDIKPSNVMVTMHDGTPVPKVIDFGVAKAISHELTEKTMFTAYGQMIGTPQYMSPEQAEMSGLDVDTRSDVYSLGVLLYELITGSTPLDLKAVQRTAYADLCRQIREVEAPKPSARISTLSDVQRSTIAQQRQIEPQSLRQLVHGDLDRIVLKALDKDREQRYETPKELGADLKRFLEDKPVLAVPPSQLYLARKYFRRHKVTILTAATVILSLIMATVFSTWQAMRATNAERAAVIAKKDALDSEKLAVAAREDAVQTAEQRRRLLYAADMKLADQLWNSPFGRTHEIDDLLAAWIPVDDSQPDLREFSWRHQWSRLHEDAAVVVWDTGAANVSLAGNLITADSNGLREWDANTGVSVQRWRGDASRSVLSPGGRWAAVLDADAVKLIDLAEGKAIRDLPGNRSAFSSDGAFVATWYVGTTYGSERSRQDAQVWKLDSGEPVPFGSLRNSAKKRPINRLFLAPDGKSFTLLPDISKVTVFIDGQPTPVDLRHQNSIHSCAWSPDGRIIATGTFAGQILLRSAADLNNELIINNHGKTINSISISPDLTKLATGGSTDGTIDIWDISGAYRTTVSSRGTNSEPNVLASGDSPKDDPSQGLGLAPTAHTSLPTLLRTIKAHTTIPSSVMFSDDGTKFASHSQGVSKLWDLRKAKNRYEIARMAEDLFGGRVGLEWEDTDDGVRVKDVRTGQHEVLSGSIQAGDRIASVFVGSNDTATSVTNMDAFEVNRHTFGPKGSVLRLQMEKVNGGERVVELRRTTTIQPKSFRVAFDPTGQWLAIADRHRGATSLNLRTKEARRYKAFGISAVISRDGVLAMVDDTEVLLWDLNRDVERDRLNILVKGMSSDWMRQHWQRGGGSLAFSPNGEYLAVGTGYTYTWGKHRSDLKVWRVTDLEEMGSPVLTNDCVVSVVSFTPDSSRLVAGDVGGMIRIWRTDSWGEPQRAFDTEMQLVSLAFSQDGKTLVTADNRGSVVLWDFETGQKLRVLADEAFAATLSPDGRTLVSSSKGYGVILRDVESGMKLRSFNEHTGVVYGLAFSPDGNTLATVGSEGVLHLWDAAPLDNTDRHPLTLKSMFRLGRARNDEERYVEAESILRRTLTKQQEVLPAGHADITETRKEITFALRGQARWPIITQQPDSTKVSAGDQATLRVEVAGDGPWSLQWFRNGRRITGATDSEYHLPAVTTDHFGRYHVEVLPPGEKQALPVISRSIYLADRVNEDLRRGLKLELVKENDGEFFNPLANSAKFPHQPDAVEVLKSFEIPANRDAHYGGRISGLITPAKTGQYVFYLTASDGELSLSTNDLPDKKRTIARASGSTQRAWGSLPPESVSRPIHFEAGKRYWIEALFKANIHLDHCAVTWQVPDHPPPKNGDPPIPGDLLQHRLE